MSEPTPPSCQLRPPGAATATRGCVPGAAGRALRRAPSGDFPMLVGAAVAGVDLQLGAGSGAEPGVVEALAGYRVDQRPGGGVPLLVSAAGAGVELDGGGAGFLVAVDVQALAVDLEGA